MRASSSLENILDTTTTSSGASSYTKDAEADGQDGGLDKGYSSSHLAAQDPQEEDLINLDSIHNFGFITGESASTSSAIPEPTDHHQQQQQLQGSPLNTTLLDQSSSSLVVDNNRVLHDLKLLTRVAAPSHLPGGGGGGGRFINHLQETPRATIRKLTRMKQQAAYDGMESHKVKNQVSTIQNYGKLNDQKQDTGSGLGGCLTPSRKAALNAKRVSTFNHGSATTSSKLSSHYINNEQEEQEKEDEDASMMMMDSITKDCHYSDKKIGSVEQVVEDDEFDDEALDLALQETTEDILIQHGKLTLGEELVKGSGGQHHLNKDGGALKRTTTGGTVGGYTSSSSPLKKVTFGFSTVKNISHHNVNQNKNSEMFKVNHVTNLPLSSASYEISLSEISKKDLEESLDLMDHLNDGNDDNNNNNQDILNHDQEKVAAAVFEDMSLISNITIPDDFDLSQLVNENMDLNDILRTGDFAKKMLFDEGDVNDDNTDNKIVLNTNDQTGDAGHDKAEEARDKNDSETAASQKKADNNNSRNDSNNSQDNNDSSASQLQKQFINLFASSRKSISSGEDGEDEEDDGEHWLNSVVHGNNNDLNSSSVSDVLYMGLRHRMKEIKAEVLRKKIEATQTIAACKNEDEEITGTIMSEEDERNYVRDVEKLHLDIESLKDRLKSIESSLHVEKKTSHEDQQLDESIRETLARIQEWDQKLELQATITPINNSVFASLGQTLKFTLLFVIIMSVLWISFLSVSIWTKLDLLYKDREDIFYEIGHANISPNAYIFRFFASMVMGIEFDHDGAGGGAGGVDRIVPT